jgi:hypothetical protein
VRDSSRVVINGQPDPSDWFRIESHYLVVYSDSDPDQVIELVHSIERLDFLMRLYMKDFLVAEVPAPKFTLYF